jgi:phosphonoacetate hydrolase
VPGIYSAEINHWLWRAAAGLLETHADLDLLYVHTTDFPMHAWAPGDPRSSAHLRRLDELIGEALRAAPGAAPFATADHGMNGKNLVYDLSQALASRGRPVRLALSAEKDRYVRHHRTFGGTAWVWLNRAVFGDAATVFGDLPDGQESEVLPPEYRSHGSLHETSVPLLAWNHADYPAPPAYNKDLLTPLLNGWLS